MLTCKYGCAVITWRALAIELLPALPTPLSRMIRPASFNTHLHGWSIGPEQPDSSRRLAVIQLCSRFEQAPGIMDSSTDVLDNAEPDRDTSGAEAAPARLRRIASCLLWPLLMSGAIAANALGMRTSH